MKLGYARVSTDEQTLTSQCQRLSAAGCEKLFEEKISGAMRNRPKLEKLLDQLRKGNCSGGYATREDNPQEVARTARRWFAKSMSKASGSKSSSSIHSRRFFRSGLAGSARTSKSSAYPQLPPQSSGGQFRFPAVQMG